MAGEELVPGALLAAVNLLFIIYVVRYMPKHLITKAAINSIVDVGIDKIHKLWDENKEKAFDVLQDVAEGLMTGAKEQLLPDLVEGITDSATNKLKMAVLGQKGGLALGTNRAEAELMKAASEDFLNAQSPLLGLVAKQFPRAYDYIQKNPEVITAIPKVLQMFHIDPNALLGQVQAQTQSDGGGRFWW